VIQAVRLISVPSYSYLDEHNLIRDRNSAFTVYVFNSRVEDLLDGSKYGASTLRFKFLALCDQLLPWLESDPKLKRFVRRKELHDGLRTSSPYVPRIIKQGKRKGSEALGERNYRRGSWIGFADSKKYKDPRHGIQFQYGFSDKEAWYGICIQGDKPTGKARHDLFERLQTYNLGQIISKMRALGDKYVIEVYRDKERKPLIPCKPINKITRNQVKKLRTNLENELLWINIRKDFDSLSIVEYYGMFTSREIVRTTRDLLGFYNWLTGTKP